MDRKVGVISRMKRESCNVFFPKLDQPVTELKIGAQGFPQPEVNVCFTELLLPLINCTQHTFTEIVTSFSGTKGMQGPTGPAGPKGMCAQKGPERGPRCACSVTGHAETFQSESQFFVIEVKGDRLLTRKFTTLRARPVCHHEEQKPRKSHTNNEPLLI